MKSVMTVGRAKLVLKKGMFVCVSAPFLKCPVDYKCRSRMLRFHMDDIDNQVRFHYGNKTISFKNPVQKCIEISTKINEMRFG